MKRYTFRKLSVTALTLAALLMLASCGEKAKTAADNVAEGDRLLAASEDPGSAQKAVQCYSRALAQEPGNPRAVYGRGMARARGRDFKGALEDFNQAVQRDPKNAEAYYRRAMCRIVATGDKVAAAKDLETCLALNPQHQGAARMLNVLRHGG